MKKSDHHLILEALDGGLNSAKFDMLQSRLRREPELAALYREYALLHHGLCMEFALQPAGAAPRVVAPRVRPVRKRKPVAGMVFGVVAVVAVIAAGLWFLSRPVRVPEAEPTVSGARVLFSLDAIWQADGVGGTGAETFASLPGGGVLKLTQGAARIDLASRASAVIEAPATLVYEHDERLHLTAGSARFRQENPDAGLTVTTAAMSAEALGGEFVIWVRPNLPDELHVIDGSVRMLLIGKTDGPELEAGNAGRVLAAAHVEMFTAQPERFAAQLPEFNKHIDDGFLPGQWRVESGEPSFSAGGIQGAAFTAFRTLGGTFPNAVEPVLLATLAASESAGGAFHSPGWAGLGFMREGEEVLFFGDAEGRNQSWAIDLKQDGPLVLPDPPVSGTATMTLRYDHRSGLMTLHLGGLPLGPEICRAEAEPGLSFDEIRIGAADGAAIHVRSIQILTGGTRSEGTTPDESTSDEAAPDEAAPDEAAPDEAAPAQAVPEETISDD